MCWNTKITHMCITLNYFSYRVPAPVRMNFLQLSTVVALLPVLLQAQDIGSLSWCWTMGCINNRLRAIENCIGARIDKYCTDNVVQWVSQVNAYSTQYDGGLYSANQIRGKPDVYPNYGDEYGAWEPDDYDQTDYIEVEFPEALYVKKIAIYETYSAGGVKRISAKNSLGQWEELWSTDQVSFIEEARIFSPILRDLGFPIKEIRIDTDSNVASDYVTLDAVSMTGTRDCSQCSDACSCYNKSLD